MLNCNAIFNFNSISTVKSDIILHVICTVYNPTVAFAIKKSDSVPIAVTSGELLMIVFILDMGN